MARTAVIFVVLVFAALSHGCVPVVVSEWGSLNIGKPDSLKQYEGTYYNNGSSIELASLFWSQTELGSDEYYELEIQSSPPGSLLVRAFDSSDKTVPAKEGIFKEGEHFSFKGGFITKREWEGKYKLGIEDNQDRNLLLLIKGSKHKVLPEGGPFLIIEKDNTYIRYIRSDGRIFSLPAHPATAFTTVDEQIDHYLRILSLDDAPSKITMLKRLQGSGLWLSESRLFDEIERQVVDKYQASEMSNKSRQVLFYQVLALGYSGNEKYRETLRIVGSNAPSSRVRSHAKTAELELEKFIVWNQLIADSEYQAEGKPFYVVAYMKMVNADDLLLQRYAARGIYREKLQDPELLALVAEKLTGLYMKPGLDSEAQDAVAWLCKAIGQSHRFEYKKLLSKVAADTPYSKIMKHAKKYSL